MDEALLSRIEDASLNASAAPQQWWMDGWIVRASPGKAKRSRCINAVAAGRLSLDQRLLQAQAVYREAGLPMFMRITRFSQPLTLDADLAARGWTRLDDTRVLVCTPGAAFSRHEPAPLPSGTRWTELDTTAYAEAVGSLRGSPPEQRLAQAERLQHSPVRYRGYAIQRLADQAVLACGQFAREGDRVGLYDVYTLESERGQGLATAVCQRLLSLSIDDGVTAAYLQVEADNAPAWRIYSRLGFSEAYAYHYRQAPAA